MKLCNEKLTALWKVNNEEGKGVDKANTYQHSTKDTRTNHNALVNISDEHRLRSLISIDITNISISLCNL